MCRLFLRPGWYQVMAPDILLYWSYCVLWLLSACFYHALRGLAVHCLVVQSAAIIIHVLT